MNEPGRLFDGEAPESLKAMIAAARAEQPRADALEKTLALTAAAGTAGSLLLGGAIAELSAAPASGSTLFALKWAGIGMVAGASALGALELRERWAEDAGERPAAPAAGASVSVSVKRPSRAEPALPEPPLPSSQPDVVLEAPAARRTAPTAPARSHEDDRPEGVRGPEPALPERSTAAPVVDDPLLQEVLLLDGARAALRAGDLSGAERRLAQHRGSFARGKLAPEALYLELQIRERRGDQAGARRIARQIVTRFPDTPPASRARALLEQQIP